MTSQIVAASRALQEASRRRNAAPLTPAISRCPHCRTMRVITSPVPASCPDCGRDLEAVPSWRLSARVLSGPGSAA